MQTVLRLLIAIGGVGLGAVSAQPSAAPVTAASVPSAPLTADGPICVSIGFDLRGMPHRGPRDVDPRSVESRRAWLAQQVRDATAEPKPTIFYPPTPTVFSARFVQSVEQSALARCQAAVMVVAPPRKPGPRRGRPDFRGPKVHTPCAPCPADLVAPPSTP